MHPPGIVVPFPGSAARSSKARTGPLRIAWVSRWEHDKDPETFFAAIRRLRERGVEIELTMLGESYSETPGCFEAARSEFADVIRHWGYVDEASEYRRLLADGDVVVSTARHEF